MASFSTALENFIFRGFNFFGEARRSEYWMVLPLVWVAIIGLAVLDLRDVWHMLLQREPPSLNPLHYAAPMLFLVTLIPRYALTVRRLNDAGRSPKWALLPLKATGMFIVLGIGLLSTGLMQSDTALAGAFTIGMMFSALWSEINWEVAYTVAAVLNATDPGLLLSVITLPDLGALAQGVVANFGADPATASKMLLVLALIVALPFVTMAVFLLMMLAPSQPSVDGHAAGFGGRKGGSDKPSRAFASYAILGQLEQERRNPQLAAARRAQGSIDAKELYRSRVLRQSEPQ